MKGGHREFVVWLVNLAPVLCEGTDVTDIVLIAVKELDEVEGW